MFIDIILRNATVVMLPTVQTENYDLFESSYTIFIG